MHQNVDHKRDQNPKRKKMHHQIDNSRNQTEKRRFFHNVRDTRRYQKKLHETFATDTGFDIICSSCLQYKNKNYCKPIIILSQAKQKKFIVKNCAIL